MQPPPADAAPAAEAPARPARASRIAYQPALDGLRALAILTIMLYHGQVSWPRGGYLSVDLFFVLSGYLITTLLLAEWEARAAIDLKRFWSGRARRLLPALLLMLGGIAACAGTRWRRCCTWPTGASPSHTCRTSSSSATPRRSPTCGRWGSRSSTTCCGRWC